VPDRALEDLLRELGPQVLGALVRRYGHFDTSEDAVQEALVAAARQWPADGVPERPLGWLIRVASRRLIDLLRSEQTRRRREDQLVRRALPQQRPADGSTVPTGSSGSGDDTLIVLFLCCHPALTPTSQIALTLRAVGGLTTGEIAHAFLTSETTMTRRITRAKQTVAASQVPFRLPPGGEVADRVRAVLHVLYLIFTEGYAATSGDALVRTELSREAIRLTRLVRRLLPDDPEVTGLLALMLLTDARRPARTDPTGRLVPMAEQDRSRWDQQAIADGVALVSEALRSGRAGPYQLQAAIAAVHDQAPTADGTDWQQIVALYRMLMQLSDNPVVRLNHAVAVAMVDGPRAGLDRLAELDADERLGADHRLVAARAHLLEQAGERVAAQQAYAAAARLAGSIPQRRYLNDQAARLASEDSCGS